MGGASFYLPLNLPRIGRVNGRRCTGGAADGILGAAGIYFVALNSVGALRARISQGMLREYKTASA
jgi:hypothetical protein